LPISWREKKHPLLGFPGIGIVALIVIFVVIIPNEYQNEPLEFEFFFWMMN